MAKNYEVLKSVKVGGVEYDAGQVVSLDPSTGSNLVDQGFLKEAETKTGMPESTPTRSESKKDAKKGDGL